MKMRLTAKHGPKNSIDRPIKGHDFNDEQETEQWNWFTKDIQSELFIKNLTREWTQIFKSFSMISNHIHSTNNFDFTKLKKEDKFMFQYYHWGAKKMMMDKREILETLRLV